MDDNDRSKNRSARPHGAKRPEGPKRKFGDKPAAGRPEGAGKGKFSGKRFSGEGGKPQDGERRGFGPRKPGFGKPSPGKSGPRRDGKPSDRPAHRPARGDVDVVVRAPRRSFHEDAAPQAAGGEAERIAKRLARAGISSRRDAEMLIAQGRVRVNGAILATPARDVTAADRIEVDGKEIPPIERTRLFLFHKPAGVVTTNRDPEGRKTVFDELPKGLPRLITVGRLDINTEGLLLLTNDGGLARALELPATGWMRRYRARVHGKVDEARLAALKDGIAVDGVFYGAVEATLEREQGTNAWLSIGLREGKNREVKNILGALGLEVTRLIRVSYGPFQLGELELGHVQEIRGRTLRDQLGEKLVEESGANFDADIVKPFSNKPVHRRDQPDEERPARAARAQREISVGEGGLVRGFRKDRERAREEFRDRLTTTRPKAPYSSGFGEERGEGRPRPPRDGARDRDGGGKRAGGRPSERREEGQPENARTANVWRAPGARPQAKRPSERAAAKRDVERRSDGPPRSSSRPGGFKGKPAGGRPGGRPGGKPSGGRPPRKG